MTDGMTDRGTGVGLRFTEGLKTVQGAGAFLLRRHRGRGVAEQAGCQDLAEHVRHQLEAFAEERPARLRVLVLGEFKSGKSSLINCLVGKPVAATDVGELTAAVCRIVPTDGGWEGAVMHADGGERSADVKRPDLKRPDLRPDLRFSVPDFLAACKRHGERARSGEPSPLDGYVSADLYVRTSLPVELVDTPGLGAAQKNEVVAMDALTQADLVLLAIDSDNLGGARDAVLTDRVRDSGQPVLVAVTKTDLLDEDEQDEVMDFVAKTYRLPRNRLFPVSARRFETTGTEPGIQRLREHLLQAAPEKASLRDRALLAQVYDLATELKAGLEKVEEAIGVALDDVRQNREVVEQTARLVTEDIAAEVASMIRRKLQAEAEGILLRRIHNPATRLTEEEFAAALEQSVRNVDAQPFWDHVRISLEVRFQKDWSEGIKRQLEILNANLEQHRRDIHAETSALSDMLAQEEVGRLERKRYAVETAVTAGTTAVALLVVGFPLLLVAATAIPGAWAYYSHKSRSEQEPAMGEIGYNARLAVSQWVDDYVRQVMAGFEAKLLRENLSVARQASDSYGRQITEFAGTEEEISELLEAARRYVFALSALTAGSRLLPSDA